MDEVLKCIQRIFRIGRRAADHHRAFRVPDGGRIRRGDHRHVVGRSGQGAARTGQARPVYENTATPIKAKNLPDIPTSSESERDETHRRIDFRRYADVYITIEGEFSSLNVPGRRFGNHSYRCWKHADDRAIVSAPIVCRGSPADRSEDCDRLAVVLEQSDRRVFPTWVRCRQSRRVDPPGLGIPNAANRNEVESCRRRRLRPPDRQACARWTPVGNGGALPVGVQQARWIREHVRQEAPAAGGHRYSGGGSGYAGLSR